MNISKAEKTTLHPQVRSIVQRLEHLRGNANVDAPALDAAILALLGGAAEVGQAGAGPVDAGLPVTKCPECGAVFTYDGTTRTYRRVANANSL
jgi:hypothetical protein